MARSDAQFVLSAVDQTKAAFNSVKSSFGDLTGSVTRAQGLLGGLGAGFTLAAVVGQIRSVIDVADDLGKLSQSVGVGVEALSALQYGAELAGVSSEELAVALKELNKSVAEGDKVFERIGLDPRQFRDTETLLRAIAQRFSEVEDGAAKTAAANDLFGRSGVRLIPLLNQGAAGFEEFTREAERLGIVISTKTAAAAEKFNDDLTRLGKTASSVFRQLAEDALPILQKITDQLLAGREAFGSFGRFAVEQPISDLWRSASEQLSRYRKELEQLQRNKGEINPFGEGSELGDREGQLKRLIAYYERLQKIARDDALAITGGARDLDPRDIRGNPGAGVAAKGKFGEKADEEASKRAVDDAKRRKEAADNYIASLAKEFLGVRNLSREEEVLEEIQLGRMVKLTKAEQQRALVIAREIDAVNRRKDAEKDAADSNKREEDALQQSRRNSARVFDELLQGQKDAAEKQAQEVASIIGRTFSGQLAEIDKMERALKEALVRGSQGLENGINVSQFREALDLLEQMREEVAAQQLPDEFEKLRDKGKDAFDDLKSSIEGWGRSTSRVFADVVAGGQSLADGLRTIFSSLAAELLEQYLYKQIFAPLFDIVGGALGGSSLAGLFGGPRAAGGPVSGGKMYLVGEKGPELFVPGRSGSIVPNGAGGGGGVNIVQNIHVDARADVASVTRAMQTAKEQAKAEILDSRRRGGVFA